jgi:hypothetical protein
MTITPDAIAVCQHPDGGELHIPLADMSGSCFCNHGEEYTDNHGARPYVALDVVVDFVRSWGDSGIGSAQGKFLAGAFAQAIEDHFTPASTRKDRS